jgi:mono/diheme cytochrome c family protein
MVKAKTLQCKHCHGLKGDGKGGMASDSFPAPRNFTCTEMMKNIPDGQLFWAIGNGLPHTSMPFYDNLSDKQIWQILLYIRKFAKQ